MRFVFITLLIGQMQNPYAVPILSRGDWLALNIHKNPITLLIFLLIVHIANHVSQKAYLAKVKLE